MKPRRFAIGDIHGHRSALENLIRFARIGAEDTVVALGDYVDGGPDSRGVIEVLLKLREMTNLICLLGNHELMLTRARESPEALKFWLDVGGDMTLKSYGVTSLNNIPQTHWDFIMSCRRYYEDDDFIFVHANLDPSLPLEHQPDHELLWNHLEFAPWHCSGKIMVCGHSPQKSGIPLHLGRAVCIDTDVHRTGWLTCFEPRTGRYWQANDEGRTRAANLEAEE